MYTVTSVQIPNSFHMKNFNLDWAFIDRSFSLCLFTCVSGYDHVLVHMRKGSISGAEVAVSLNCNLKFREFD